MKKSRSAMFTGLAIMLVAVSAFLGLAQNSANAMCSKNVGQHYRVVIGGDKASATDITGKVCDTITFTNADKETRGIAFGPHEDHVPYDGIGETFLNHGQSFTIHLNQTGKFHWHDHMHDEVQGYFTVRK